MASIHRHDVDRWGRLRPLLAALGVAAGLSAVAVALASALDDPVGAGGRDPAMAVAETTAVAAEPMVPESDPDEPPPLGVGLASNLPPLAPVLETDPPRQVLTLHPERQIVALTARARADGRARHWAELGVRQQLMGDRRGARLSYAAGLRADPGHLPSRVGAMIAAVERPDQLDGLAQRLERLARAHPTAQVVLFNRGWVEVYRGRWGEAARLLERAQRPAPHSRLGDAARSMVVMLGQMGPDAA